MQQKQILTGRTAHCGGVVLGLVLLAGSGCVENPLGRMNAPPQGEAIEQNEMREPYVYMVDNAMLEDMSVSPVHFVPHQAELNALGVRRLNRYADILDMYGGTLRYDGGETDKKLLEARMARVKSYLVSAGLSSDRFDVTADMAGGEGGLAAEAIKVRQGSRYKPQTAQGGSSPAAYMIAK